MTDSLYGKHLYVNSGISFSLFIDGDYPGQRSFDDNGVEYKWNDVSWSVILKNTSIQANTIVLLGDSLTLKNHPSTNAQAAFAASPSVPTVPDATNVYNYYNGWFHWANAYLSQRFEVLAYSGVSGDAYVDMLARLSTDVLAFNPKYCFVQSSANGIAAGLTAAAELTSLQSIVTTLQANGIIPIVSKLGFSRSPSATELDEWNDLTIQMMRWLNNNGVISVDLQAGMGDVTAVTSITRSGSTATVTTTTEHNYLTGTGVVISGATNSEYNITTDITRVSSTVFTYAVSGTPGTPDGSANIQVTSTSFGFDLSEDGLHPNAAGAQLMGYNGLTQLDSYITKSHIGVNFNTDYQTGFLNPLNIGSNAVPANNGMSGNIGNNWTAGASQGGTESVVCAKVARTDEMGEWTELTFSGTPVDTAEYFELATDVVTNTNSGFVTGDIVTAYVEMEITTPLVNMDMPNIRWFWNSTNTPTKEFRRNNAFGDTDSVISTPFIIRLPTVTLGAEAGANTTTLLIEFFPTAAAALSGVIKIGRVWFEKVG